MAVPVPDAITAIAALITAIGSLIASFMSNRASRRVGDELANSVDGADLQAERIQHLIEMQRSQGQMQRSQGHQIGELKTDVHGLRRDVSALITKEILE